jgi:hypothetical protein
MAVSKRCLLPGLFFDDMIITVEVFDEMAMELSKWLLRVVLDLAFFLFNHLILYVGFLLLLIMLLSRWHHLTSCDPFIDDVLAVLEVYF